MANFSPSYSSRAWKSCLNYGGVCSLIVMMCFIVSTFNENQDQPVLTQVGNQLNIQSNFNLKQNGDVPMDDVLKMPLTVLSQDDPRLIKAIRTNYLNPPSQKPYNLTTKKNDPSLWQARHVRKLLKKKRNGFFIECGAHNGEFLSNTLMFEKVYDWEGVLIEASPDNYKQLQSRHRKAWTVPACLSINNYPSEAMLKKTWNIEGGKQTYPFWKITNDPIMEDKEDVSIKVQCFPLFSILMALNRTQIDYFSLDIEGNELNVLKTIPWDRVEITVVSAEFNHVDQGKNSLREYMESQGYEVYLDGATLRNEQNIDYIFYHPKYISQNIGSLE